MHRVEARLDRAFAAVQQAGPVGVAVSGGSDSTALLLAATPWAQARGVALRVLTVDHGLRPAAREEATGVAQLCGRLGWPHDTLRLPPDVDVGSTARARTARHRAFAHWASTHGVRVLLLGHTADDAAETVVMRAARLSPGVSDRVAFAQPQLLSLSPLWPEGRSLLLARPLLGQARATLQDWLRAQGHTWAEDPTNADPERERARARAWLGGAPARREAALRLWRAGLRARRGVMAELADLTPTFAPDGSVEVAADGVPARALTLLLAVASGSPRLPALSVAEAVLDALASGQTSLTRAGVLVRKRAERLVLSRDSGALADGGGRRVDGVWDGRFSVTAAQSGDDTLIAPVGLLDHLPPDLRLALLAHPPDVRATLPALWRGGACEGLAPLAPLTGLRWRQLTWDGRGEAPLAKPGAGGLGQAR